MCLEYEVKKFFNSNVRILKHEGWMNPKLIICSKENDLTADPYDLSDLDSALKVIQGQTKMTNAHMVLLSYTMTSDDHGETPLQAIYAYGETEFERRGIYQEFWTKGNKVILLGTPTSKVLENELVGFFHLNICFPFPPDRQNSELT